MLLLTLVNSDVLQSLVVAKYPFHGMAGGKSPLRPSVSSSVKLGQNLPHQMVGNFKVDDAWKCLAWGLNVFKISVNVKRAFRTPGVAGDKS